MTSVGTVESGTLDWVKTEIDQTLGFAREAIKDFATRTSDLTPLRIYANHLHQVVGTLQMVELDGAAMLAQEAESLADVMLHNGQGCDMDAVTVLLDSSLKDLSSYLEKLQQGMSDVPVRNLDLMNELRQARGDAPLEIFSIFSPDLEVYPPRPLKPVKLDAESYKRRIAEIRRDFQSHLLQWLRNAEHDHLRALGGLAEQLQSIARFNSVAQLWWVAQAHIAVLADWSSESINVQKHIPARLDQMLRRLIEGGEAALAKDRDENLIKQMLYDIGRAKSKQDLVVEIQRAFNLTEILYGEAELEDQQLIPQSLRGELEAELNSVKDQLTEYFEASRRDPETLDRISGELKNIAAFVQHKGPSGLPELITELVDTLQLTRAPMDGIDDHAIALQIAETLLFMEEFLKQNDNSSKDWLSMLNEKVERLSSLRQLSTDSVNIDELKAANFTTSNVKSLLPAVANEIYVNLQAAEEALESFANKPEQTFVLEQVPKNLAQVQGTLQMLGQYKAADMLSIAGEYIEKLVKNEIDPSYSVIDSLAVAIVTAQSFVEGLENDRPHGNEIVERAIQDLEDVLTERELADFDPVDTMVTLDESLETWLADNDNYDAFKTLRQALKEISAVASVRNQPKPRQIAREMNNLLDIITEDPSFLSAEIGQTLRRSLQTLKELVPDKTALSAPEADVDALPEVEEKAEIQPEIIEIFREEAVESTSNIDRLFAHWREDTADDSVLADLRRQFHTLKGSGRTANVGPFAELAWIVENLLNHVLDEKLIASDELLSFVSDAKSAIAESIQDNAFGASHLDLRPWEERAQELLAQERGEETTPAYSPLANVENLHPGKMEQKSLEGGRTDTATDPLSSSKLDDTVVRIFTQETLGHIGTIRNFVSERPDSVSVELLRAVHTLRGSSRSLHLVEMSNVFLALDEYLNEVQARGDTLDQRDLQLLDKAAVLSANALDRLNKERTFPATLRGEFDSLGQTVAAARASERTKPPQDDITMLGELISGAEKKSGSAASFVATNDESLVAEDDTFDVKDIFCEESIDVLARINTGLEQWRDGAEAASTIPTIKRDLHTLKGSAFAAGFDIIGQLSHLTETLLEQSEKGLVMDENDLRAVLEEAHDTLSEMVVQVEQGGSIRAADQLVQRIADLASEHGAVDVRLPVAGKPVHAVEQTEEVKEFDVPEQIGPPTAVADAASQSELDDDDKRADSARNVLRVNTDVLDKLVNYAGEVSITRAQMQEQLGVLKANLSELSNNVMRFTDQLRRLDVQADSQIRARSSARRYIDQDSASPSSEFDPLEMDRYTELQQLSRSLSESLDDLITIQAEISQFVHRSENVLRQQAQLSAELQDGLMSTRLVPFSTLTPRLRHQVRQTARELGKEADLSVTGGVVEIDRKVLDGISEALEHMIRNALDHGVEDPKQREEKGKSRSGAITIDCKQQGNEAVIRFSDDGAGLNMDEIRAKALADGLVRDQESLSDQEIIQLVVLPGFTTTSEVTQLSGRGVGMDVVHNAVRRLGGSISVESEVGKGTTFIISLPLSLSITQAIFVRCGPQEFAVPLNAISNVLKVDIKELDSKPIQGQASFERGGKVYPLINLTRCLNLTEEDEPQDRVPILIVRMGAREVAVRVTKLQATQEVVVKSLGSHVAHLNGIAGATIRGDGTVVLILDLAEIWMADEREEVADSASTEKVQNLPVVMVVDDSLTVRKVTASNLSRHGMEVVMAKDGLDALEQMNKKLPDLMLVDIEMPRMDGYELTQQIRSDAATKHIPIVIITSRAGAKHREKAIALGANGYLTKPYQEDELVANVEAFLSPSKTG